MAIYAAMAVWTLPRDLRRAGGAPAFDMRPLGYSFDEAPRFLDGADAGRPSLYRGVQHRLDAFYPALLAIAVGLGLYFLAPLSPPWLEIAWRPPGRTGNLFRLSGKQPRRGDAGASPGLLDAGLVAAASRATLLKSMFTTPGMMVMLAVGSWRGAGGARAGKARCGPATRRAPPPPARRRHRGARFAGGISGASSSRCSRRRGAGRLRDAGEARARRLPGAR